MRIRWKILLVLISISIIPMLAMRWNANRIIRGLAGELGGQTRIALVRQSTLALKRLVEDHARVLKREGQLIEMLLKVHSAELEKRFSSPVVPADRPLPDRDWQPGGLGDREPVSYCRLKENGRCEPLVVSHMNPRWTLPPDMDKALLDRTVGQLEGMTAFYEAAGREFPDLFMWQILVMENGIQTIYPGPSGDPVYDGRRTDWYRRVKQLDTTAWSMPIVDPLTGRIVVPVAAPVHGPGGAFIGAAAVMVPVSALLHENQHIRTISENVTSLLVRAEPRQASGAGAGDVGLLILASENVKPSRYERWRYLQSARWLSSDAPDAMAPVVSDLMKRRSGLSEVSYGGRSGIRAYSGISTEGTSLLLIVPKSDLVADAENMQRYVQARFVDEMKTTGTIFSSVLVCVFLLSLALSRYISGNIHKLLDGSRRLATGDFSTRIDIRSRDEIGELGRAFNRMVPDLEERIRLKQGIEVASSVQRSLLPKSSPVVSGFDIAAVSRYCDETGGDFHDFIALDRGGQTGIGIAVGDVSGHGVSAALLMATARAFLKGRRAQPGSPAEIIDDVNRLLCRDTDDTGQFLTLFYMEIATGSDVVDWVRAGHDPGLLYDPETGAFSELKGAGAALGVDEAMACSTNRRAGLRAGQVIAVGTDGIWETRNPAGKMYGKERFKAAIRSCGGDTARKILEGVVSDLSAFRGTALQSDDVTLVIVKVGG